MRVQYGASDGFDVEAEVIAGKDFDPLHATRDLGSILNVRCDNGAIHEIHGWLVDVTVMDLLRSCLV